jgi:hypothetical protein
MKVSRKLQSLAALCALGGSLTSINPAIAGESLDRFGRLLGFGWSDGYHACTEDCFQLGENLPPRSYSADHALYAPRTATVSHVTSPQPHAHCETCNSGGNVTSAPKVHAIPQPYMQYEMTEAELNAHSIAEPSPSQQAPTPDLLDEPLELENPASPSDVLQVPKTSGAQRVPSETLRSAPPKIAPPKTVAPKSLPQAPVPAESDDDLLLDLPSDTDGLIDELPPPARDPLSPENSSFVPRPDRRRVAPIARTSAESPLARPTRLGSRDPQRLPSTR